MKVLWISNAPWAASGYGSQTRQVVPRMAAAGIEVECVANDGTRGDRDWNGILVRGSGSDRYSRDSLREDFERSGADWIVSLYDAWVYTDAMRDPFEGLPHVASWVPVDHFPVPLSLYQWLDGGHLSIAMSRFGESCLKDVARGFGMAGGMEFPVRYAPHAVDAVYTPRDRSFRGRIDVPDTAYLVGIVAANNGTKIYDRKGFGDMAAALAVFMGSRPDAFAYVHTIRDTHDGMNLEIMFQAKGVPADRLRWADQYALKKQSVSDDDMASIYSSFDVLLATSRGEGFGIPVIEAQACGVPVIASNWTAQPELVGEPFDSTDLGRKRYPSGWLVAVDPDWDPRHGADFAKPLVGSIIHALMEAYELRGDASLRDAAIAKAEDYRADAVFERHWQPILADMAAATMPIPLNRAARRKALRSA